MILGHDSQNAESSLNSSSSISSPKKRKTQSSMEKSVSSDSLQTLSSETQGNATKTSAGKIYFFYKFNGIYILTKMINILNCNLLKAFSDSSV